MRCGRTVHNHMLPRVSDDVSAIVEDKRGGSGVSRSVWGRQVGREAPEMCAEGIGGVSEVGRWEGKRLRMGVFNFFSSYPGPSPTLVLACRQAVSCVLTPVPSPPPSSS